MPVYAPNNEMNLLTPPNLFGRGNAGVNEYLAQRRREKEREERNLVEAIASSLREEEKAKQTKELRDAQEKEYQKGLKEDRRKQREEKKKQRKQEKEQQKLELLKAKFEQEPSSGEGSCSVTFQDQEGRFERVFSSDGLCEDLYLFVLYVKLKNRDGNKQQEFELILPPNTVIDRGEKISNYGKKLLLFVRDSEPWRRDLE